MQPTAEQFTEKAWAAILSAQQLAQKRRHQQLETEHLLQALLEQDGLASRILEKAGVTPAALQSSVDSHLTQQPALQSPPESVYLGKGLSDLLDRADSLKQDYGDSYISVEHLLLALADDSRCGRRLLSQAGAGPWLAQKGHQRCARQPDRDRSEPGGLLRVP
ncbi:Endopeptidase Clp ATP-binding chain B [Synechococcus sp. WH 7803]|nr:Endopeptidase Clp ATP-binding chain B [Synechococcus sp. WH 7803]